MNLTSAHLTICLLCLRFRYQVRLGEFDTTTTIDCVEDDCADPVRDVLINAYVVHPDYYKQNGAWLIDHTNSDARPLLLSVGGGLYLLELSVYFLRCSISRCSPHYHSQPVGRFRSPLSATGPLSPARP